MSDSYRTRPSTQEVREVRPGSLTRTCRCSCMGRLMAPDPEHDFPRLFSVTEAQRTLPLVRSIVQDILDLGAQARDVVSGRTDEFTIEGLQDRLREHLSELAGIGCYYKDWNFRIGLVDFPALIDGEVVFLCWRSDEPELRYYHRIEDGYAGRRPLPRT